MSHRVVIIGAGYAGLPAAKCLAARVRPDEVSVELISAFADFVERPRLHQLAVGQNIAQRPLARYVRGSDVRLTIASVTGIDLDAQTVQTTDGRGNRRGVQYDTLVYALGSNIEVAAVPGVAEHCATLVGAPSAVDLHNRLTELNEHAGGRSPGCSGSPTVAVCGGGLTGIEISAEIAEAFPALQVRQVSTRAPGGWLSVKGRRYLAETFAGLGIAVTDGARVVRVDRSRLELSDNRQLPFDLCVWAGGFAAPTLARTAGLAVNTSDRALVDRTLRSVSHRQVYVIGDAAAVTGSWGSQLSMGCRTGGLTGPRVAAIIAARLSGRDPKPFNYRYFHECISLGRSRGLVQFLNADETPKNRILTGRKAITYKNVTLNGARVLFRRSGQTVARRRHLAPVPERGDQP